VLHLAASALNFGSHRLASIGHLTAVVERTATFTIRWRDPHRAAARIAAALDRSSDR
jgi:hypothetical protein